MAVGCTTPEEALRLEIADLCDRRLTMAGPFEAALAHRDPTLRREAARAAGRTRSPALIAALSRALRVEDDAAARGEQLFALGQIGSAEALGAVLEKLEHADFATRARACEALGKLRRPEVAPNLVARLQDERGEVRGAALLALSRLLGLRSGRKEPLDPAVSQGLSGALPGLVAQPDATVAWKAALATAEIEDDGRLPAALVAARSADSGARFFAALALGRIADEPSRRAAELIALLSDGDVFVATQAALAMTRLPAAAWSDAAFIALERALRSDSRRSDHHLRRAALSTLCDRAEAAAPPIAAERVARWLADGSEDSTLLVRAEAWRSAVRLGGEAEVAEVARHAAAPVDVHVRVAATRALAAAKGAAIGIAVKELTFLALGSDPYVASEAWIALLALVSAPPGSAQDERISVLTLDRLRSIALHAAEDPDYAVAASAIDLLAKVGAAEDLPAIEAAFARLGGDEAAEARANAVKAAATLSSAAAVPLLQRAAADASAAVRAAARSELARLEAPLPPEPVAGPDSPSSSVELAASERLAPAADPRVRLRFAGGDVVVQLFAAEAPLHAAMFRRRVEEGRCDGLPIHRIVSGFVVQGLDPRGDGWGTGGVFLRDEINPVPFERGAVGMPNAGPDSGGCQLFAMLMSAPHLDGRYTVFGRVIEGMDVVDALDLGERCLAAEVLE
jgi:peptidylprolyl isomerase